MLPREIQVTTAGRSRPLAALPSPLDLDALVPSAGPWEMEIGFGKGRFLLAQAAACPERRFLGIERAGKYFRLAAARAGRRGLGNLLLLEGEALFVLATALPGAFAQAIHIYFPDPWPKARHHRRRLLDAESVDLVLRALTPGGCLFFATDFLPYGERVREVLASHGALSVSEIEVGWPEGPRTNYEAKYVAEGRSIVRLEARTAAGAPGLHPRGAPWVLAATAPDPVGGPREEAR
jgi:tRNA (guanine-N7-)-methyltransferase